VTRLALAFMVGALAFGAVHAVQGPPAQSAPSFAERWAPALEQPLTTWPHHWTSGACDWLHQTCNIT
jgi:hypothetical protein